MMHEEELKMCRYMLWRLETIVRHLAQPIPHLKQVSPCYFDAVDAKNVCEQIIEKLKK